MTKTEIIIETKEFYDANPHLRGVRRLIPSAGETCVYQSPTEPERKCAVGRCMTKEALESLGQTEGGIQELESGSPDGVLDTLLIPKYRGHSSRFWANLQGFHDEKSNWDENGLSPRGLIAFKNLLSNWSSE